MNLPAEFVERLREILDPADFENVVASFSKPRPASFRVNTLIAETPVVLGELEELGVTTRKVPWCPEAFTVNPEFRSVLVESDAFRDGRIYIQNLSSLLPVCLLDPEPGQAVLDLAAAPGGKTLHLAARMANQGRLSAVEVVRSRYYKLRQNLQLGGATLVKTYLKDGRSVGNKTPEQFDLVLLDAPCSSEARFHVDEPESWSYWGSRKIREQSRKQRGLLKSAIQALRPGGRLAYCTCSFAPEENEAVVDWQLKRDPTLSVVEVKLPLDNVRVGLSAWKQKPFSPDLARACRVLPSAEMDAFFVCLIEKSLDQPRKPRRR